MKKNTSHLPEHIQTQLKSITNTIRKNIRVEMIILFGSYARGDYVEKDEYQEGHITYCYQSDFDILAVVYDPKLEIAINHWYKIEKKLKNNKNIQTPIGLIRENINSLNKKISDGRYFYTDILKEGIMLFDSHRYKLSKPRQLKPEERQKMARDDFGMWFEKAQYSLDDFLTNYNKQRNNKAAFELHQATESLFTAMNLTYTGYRPKKHDLEILYTGVQALEPKLNKIFPKKTKQQKHLFELLRRAYVDARYEKSYEIKKDELKYLAERVEKLQSAVKKFCEEEIEKMV